MNELPQVKHGLIIITTPQKTAWVPISGYHNKIFVLIFTKFHQKFSLKMERKIYLILGLLEDSVNIQIY